MCSRMRVTDAGVAAEMRCAAADEPGWAVSRRCAVMGEPGAAVDDPGWAASRRCAVMGKPGALADKPGAAAGEPGVVVAGLKEAASFCRGNADRASLTLPWPMTFSWPTGTFWILLT